MTDTQLYLAIGIPVISNGILVTILILYIKGQIDKVTEIMNARFEAVFARFDAAKAELLRVEGVLDARVRHLEDKKQ